MEPDWAPGSKITSRRMGLLGRLFERFVADQQYGAILFSGIPQTYRDLRLVIRARSSDAAAQAGVFVQMNSTATGYASSLTQDFNAFASGPSTNITAYHVTGQVGFNAGFIPAATATSGAHSLTQMKIPGYADTGQQKMADCRGGYLDGTRHYVMQAMSHVADTAAVQSLVVLPTAGAFTAGSTFSLYGE